MKKTKLLVFDFDGTICDSYDFVLNKLLKYLNKDPASFDHQYFRRLPTRQVLASLNLTKFDTAKLIYKVRSDAKNSAASLRPIPMIPQILKNLYQRGYKLAILSTNSKEAIKKFCQANDLLPIFDDIVTSFSFFGKHYELRKLAKRHGVTGNNLMYFGDETRDIIAAKNTPCVSVSTAWGFSDPEALRNAYPDFLLNTPPDLLKLIDELERKSSFAPLRKHK